MNGLILGHRRPMRSVVGRDPVVHTIANGRSGPARACVHGEHVVNGRRDRTVPSRRSRRSDGVIGPTGSKFSIVQRFAAPCGIAAVHRDEAGSVPLQSVAEAGNLTDAGLHHERGRGTADGPSLERVTVVVVAVFLTSHVEGVAVDFETSDHLPRRSTLSDGLSRGGEGVLVFVSAPTAILNVVFDHAALAVVHDPEGIVFTIVCDARVIAELRRKVVGRRAHPNVIAGHVHLEQTVVLRGSCGARHLLVA